MLIDSPLVKDGVMSGSSVFTGSVNIRPSDLTIQSNAVYLTLDINTGKIGKSTVISTTTSGTSGVSGTAGTAGTSATAGTSGLTGYPGSSGTSGAGTIIHTGSTYPITSSWSITSSYTLNGGTQLYTGSTYPITASWAASASYALYALSGGTKLYTGSTYPITSSWGVTASYALNSGNSVAVLFTSSFFKGELLSKITCSAYYSYYHLSTQNNLNIKLTGSNTPSAFSIRLVNSGSVSNRVRLSPYNTIEWAGVASGFDNTGSILMAGNQELFFSFIFYNNAGIGRPVSKSIAFITDLKTPGLQNKTTAQNLYILGDGLSGMVSGSINDPNTYIYTVDGGGTEPSAAGLNSKPFWGWMPVYVEGYGRKFLPLYE